MWFFVLCVLSLSPSVYADIYVYVCMYVYVYSIYIYIYMCVCVSACLPVCLNLSAKVSARQLHNRPMQAKESEHSQAARRRRPPGLNIGV